MVEFTNGSAFMVPARALQDLEDASDEDLAGVTIEKGYALRWDRLDVDLTIPGLIGRCLRHGALYGLRGRTKPFACQGESRTREWPQGRATAQSRRDYVVRVDHVCPSVTPIEHAAWRNDVPQDGNRSGRLHRPVP